MTHEKSKNTIRIEKICSAAQRVFVLCFALLVAFALIPERGDNGHFVPQKNTEPVFFYTLEGESTDTDSYDDIYVWGSPASPLPSVSAQGAALVSADTGELIYGKNSNGILPMASTTKIMTALIVLEKCSPDEIFTVPKEACGIEGSSIYLTPGEKITVRDLLYGLMLESGNDAATALAIATSGSTEAFVGEMNKKASELGLTCTSFANPHGLSSENHYTTAYELAKITCSAMKHPLFREIVSTKSYSVTSPDGVPMKYFSNHNRLLRSYNGANGVKTGYTIASGRCLVTSAERSGSTFIAVTLNDRADWKDHAAMLDFAFANYKCYTFFEPGTLQLSLGGRTYSNKDSSAVLLKSGETKAEVSVFLS